MTALAIPDAAAAWAAADAVRRRWQSGEEPDAAAVVEACPELAGCRSAVIDLAYQEYLLREQRGAAPRLSQFAERFPAYRSSIRDMLDAHQLFLEQPDLLTEADDSWPEAGTSVEGLDLLAELGRGAFGRAYLTYDPATDRTCALKLAPGGDAEARVIGRLSHPHVTDVYWARRVGTRTGVCMPFHGASTLADVLAAAFPRPNADTPDTASVILTSASAGNPEGDARAKTAVVRPSDSYLVGACSVAARIAEAVAYLHAEGVVHGDVKPSNVVVAPGGVPHLIDFNLAAGSAVVGVRGTPAYMSPELLDAMLARRSAASIDGPRADLFALGVLVFELLTGRHPYHESAKGGLADLATVARRGPPVMPANVPPRIATVLRACLAADPAERPESASVLAAALDRFVQAKRDRGRRLKRAAVVVAVMLTVLASASLNLLPKSAATDVAPVTPPAPADRAPETAAEFFDLGRRHLDTGDAIGARAAFVAAHERSSDPRDLAFVAYCHAFRGQPRDAADIGLRAIREGADLPEVRNLVGFALVQTSRYPEAIANLDDAIRRSPKLQAAYYNRALAIYKSTFGPDAGVTDLRCADDIAEALKLGPASLDLQYDAARIYAACSVAKPVLRTEAVAQLVGAVKAGKDPTLIRNERVFQIHLATADGFDAIFTTPRGTPAPKPANLRLVPPVR